MNNILWTLFSLLISVQLWAQDGKFKEIHAIVNSDTGPLSGIHIINISSRLATITNANGYFSIGAQLNDTLSISGVGYKSQQLVINANLFNGFSTTIELESEVVALNEVVVMPYNLSGDLTKDMGALRAEDQVSEFTLGLPNANVKPLRKSQRILHEATTGGGILPINPILNGISGRTKRLKKIVEIDLKNQRTLRVRHYYPDSLFTQQLKIDPKSIMDFMYYCETDPEFNYYARLKDKFRLWEIMKKKSEYYKKQNNIN